MRVPQFVEVLIRASADAQNALFKRVEAFVTAFQGRIAQGRMNIGNRVRNADGSAEERVILIHVVMDNFAGRAEILNRPFGSGGLERGAVMVNMIERKQSCFQIQFHLKTPPPFSAIPE